ncbi:hypothetical protein [Pseudomonas sp. R76]|uniref:hypothetical protein n=1 Tax=Pseudomonas sp. R76 TaxID=1573711 RepID=UPI00131F7C1C|nr:hypothetical protein [Pseudomonas sp. R76]QHD07835.1 hypothetical protein PspR76_19780 [Pseudomonas sp. R76]
MILMINPSTHSPIDLAMSGPRHDDLHASESQVNTADTKENAGPAAYEQAIQKFVRDGKNPELLQLREGLVRVLDSFNRSVKNDSKSPADDRYEHFLLFLMGNESVKLVEPIAVNYEGEVIYFPWEDGIAKFMNKAGLRPPVNRRELQQIIDALPLKPESPPRTSAGGLRALIQLGNKSV